MKVVLKNDVRGVGQKGDVRTVASGYARNFLLPQKLAVAATADALSVLEKQKDKIDQERQETQELHKKIVDAVNGKSLERSERAQEETLFGGVHKKDVQEMIKKSFSVDVEEQYLVMDDIKKIGEYTIGIEFPDGQTAQFTLTVTPEE